MMEFVCRLAREQSHDWYMTRQGSVDTGVQAEEGKESFVRKYITVDTSKLKQKRANREDVTVADMAVFHHNPEYFPNYLRLRSELFLYLILLAGIYYTLPVFQVQNLSMVFIIFLFFFTSWSTTTKRQQRPPVTSTPATTTTFANIPTEPSMTMAMCSATSATSPWVSSSYLS